MKKYKTVIVPHPVHSKIYLYYLDLWVTAVAPEVTFLTLSQKLSEPFESSLFTSQINLNLCTG